MDDLKSTKKGPTNSSGTNDKLDVLGSRIFFYSSIVEDKILELNKNLYDISGKLLSKGAESVFGDEKIETDPIKIHIKSYGGSVFAGLAAMDTILDIKKRVPIYTIVEGCAASAATFISCVGTKRYMRKHAYMLIHQLSSGVYGKYEEIKDEVDNIDRMMETIRKIYKEHTEVPLKKLDDILKRDIWFDAETCMKYSLVDKLI